MKLAKDLTAKLFRAPKKFKAMAKKFSNGPSATKGGSLGVWRKGRMVPAFDKAINALDVGAISKAPVETPFGYHIMRRDPLPGLVSGSHILIAYKGARRAKPTITRSEADAKKLAAKLTKELKQDPKKWGAYVLKYYNGPAAKHGGKLGTWSKGQSHPVFDKEIGSIKVGQIVGPGKTQFGYHVFLRTAVPHEFAGAHILIAYKGAQRAAPYITRTKEAAKALATEIAAKATKDPKSFAELALKNSDGPSARFGGDLGTWREGMMAPAFDATMMKLKTGEVTAKPVETPFGFHVIKRGALGGTKE